jgi:hypothetical protein
MDRAKPDCFLSSAVPVARSRNLSALAASADGSGELVNRAGDLDGTEREK